MKTRIFALLLAVICVLTLASCKKDTAASLYTNAMKAMEEAKGFEANIQMGVTMELAGESEEMDMEMVIKANGDNMYLLADDMEVTYVDGVMYTKLDSIKTKETVSLEDFKKEYGATLSSVDFPELSEEALKDIELVEDGNNRSFTITLDAATMQSYVADILGGMMGGDPDEMPDIKINAIVITPTFDQDDNMTKMVMKMDLAYDIAMIGEVKMSVNMTFEFVNPGTAPTITAPADASSYN